MRGGTLKLRTIAVAAFVAAAVSPAQALVDSSGALQWAGGQVVRYTVDGKIYAVRAGASLSGEIQATLAAKAGVPANSKAAVETMKAIGQMMSGQLSQNAAKLAGQGLIMGFSRSQAGILAITAVGLAGAGYYVLNEAIANTPGYNGRPWDNGSVIVVPCALPNDALNHEFWSISGGGWGFCPLQNAGLPTGVSGGRGACNYPGGTDAGGNPYPPFTNNGMSISSDPWNFCPEGQRDPALYTSPPKNPVDPADYDKLLTEDDVRKFVNELHKQAASQPGYPSTAIPYDPTKPVTKEDVQQVRINNPYPQTAPKTTVGDVVAEPEPNPKPGYVPWGPVWIPEQGGPVVDADPAPDYDPASSDPERSAPSPSPLPSPAPAPQPGDPQYNPDGTPKTPTTNVDFTDPNIGPPTLQDPPLWREILAPLLNGFDAWKNWTLPAHESICPTPSLELWGSTHVIDSHCALLDDHRTLIEAALKAAWVIMAILIVFAA